MLIVSRSVLIWILSNPCIWNGEVWICVNLSLDYSTFWNITQLCLIIIQVYKPVWVSGTAGLQKKKKKSKIEKTHRAINYKCIIFSLGLGFCERLKNISNCETKTLYQDQYSRSLSCEIYIYIVAFKPQAGIHYRESFSLKQQDLPINSGGEVTLPTHKHTRLLCSYIFAHTHSFTLVYTYTLAFWRAMWIRLNCG